MQGLNLKEILSSRDFPPLSSFALYRAHMYLREAWDSKQLLFKVVYNRLNI